jgi:hypothetical protein
MAFHYLGVTPSSTASTIPYRYPSNEYGTHCQCRAGSYGSSNQLQRLNPGKLPNAAAIRPPPNRDPAKHHQNTRRPHFPGPRFPPRSCPFSNSERLANPIRALALAPPRRLTATSLVRSSHVPRNRGTLPPDDIKLPPRRRLPPTLKANTACARNKQREELSSKQTPSRSPHLKEKSPWPT